MAQEDESNHRTASQYLEWLKNEGIPARYQNLLDLIDSPVGPSLFPRAVVTSSPGPTPVTPPPRDLARVAAVPNPERVGTVRSSSP